MKIDDAVLLLNVVRVLEEEKADGEVGRGTDLDDFTL